jgi:CheY-like chemotaxis protein
VSSVATGGESPTPVPAPSGVHVLLVDDEMDGRDAIKQMLEDAGAVGTAVNSAASAFASLKTHRPHVLVCDIGLPQDGLRFMRRVCADRDGHRIQSTNAGFQANLANPAGPRVTAS